MEEETRSSAEADRVRGVLIGLLAGDQNGGPVRACMALRLAESLVLKEGYDRDDVVSRYYNWHRGPPHDSERAFDTGQTFLSVFTAYNRGKSIEEAAKSMKESAGINAAHRSAPLAMCKSISDEDIPKIAQQELIRGVAWKDAKENALNDSTIVQSREVRAALSGTSSLDKGGFAPLVLGTAIHFLDEHDTFDRALYASFQYAGNANYCPVLVGSIGGARWGASTIDRRVVGVVNKQIVERVDRVADQLAEKW